MAIQKHSIPDTDSAIWAETDNLNYYVATAITPDSSGGAQNKQTETAAGTRRQYPGDTTPVGYKGGSRTYLYDPGRKSGSAIPGKPFRINDGTENRMMRFTGNWVDVHAYFTGNVNSECSLYSPTGARYIIEAAAEGVSALATYSAD